jgi:hypothetical protein
MNSAASITDATRLALSVLVDREEKRIGSRDIAIDAVARTVGSSASWVKKFISKSPEVKEPRITLFVNIRAAYETVCARVEQEHRNELLKITKLLGELNEVTAGFGEPDQSTTRATRSREYAGKGR